MTYGWAILIIAIVLVALFSLNLFNPYTFAPKASPGSCQIIRPNGPGSNIFVSAVGLCNNEIPQYVARFNGQTSYVNLSSNPSILGGTFTVSFWIRMSVFPNQSDLQISVDPVSVAGDGCNGSFNIVINQSGNIQANQCSIVVNYVSPKPLAIGSYAFVTVTHTQGNPVTLYINGVLVGESGVGVSYANTGPYWIGDGPHGHVNGIFSNVQIYNTSLSPGAVNTLYNEGIGGAPVDIQNLAGWWPLNGNAKDYSGNGNNGVPTNVFFTSNWENGYSTPP